MIPDILLQFLADISWSATYEPKANSMSHNFSIPVNSKRSEDFSVYIFKQFFVVLVKQYEHANYYRYHMNY